MSKRCLGCMDTFSDEFQVCPHCGYIVGTEADEAIFIQPGTLLHDRYIIGRVLGAGGFGVTYIGWDGKLERKVAIKEYFPAEFSTRIPNHSMMTVFDGDRGEQFRDGMKKFVEEARRLAKFQEEPGIAKVFDSFEENDTAYIIMEFLDGETLASYLHKEGSIPENLAVDMLRPIIHSLQTVHAEGIIHRDIAPDNIFLTKTGEIKLIDFGAARYATTTHSRSLTVIVKPGYSPEEQYRSRGDQGPHTDVYALASTLYKMITGKTPPDAMERRSKYEGENKEILLPPHKLKRGVSLNRENAILNAMNVRIADRTPDVATFLKELDADPPAKRKYGKIKKLNLYAMPLWAKITIPIVLIIFLTFSGLMLTGIIDFSNFTEQLTIPDGVVIVPDVEGMNREEALKKIEKKQLQVSTAGTVMSSYIPAGKIVLQDPVGGSYLQRNGTIYLTVSSGQGAVEATDGTSTVPFVTWDSLEDAKYKLQLAGLGEPIIEEAFDENVEVGHVISQSLDPDTKVDENTVMTLVISKGPQPFAMPDVTGMSQAKAEKLLTEKGLMLSIEYESSPSVKNGYIIRQSIEAGEDVIRKTSVTLIVCSSNAPIKVASVAGLTTSQATQILEEQGFRVTTLEQNSSSVPEGQVIRQSPNADTAQASGSTITLYVSKGPKCIPITFDGNGGTVWETSRTVYADTPIGSLPEAARDGYYFTGWFSDPNGGFQYADSSVLSSEDRLTLYAHWSNQNFQISWNDGSGYSVSVTRSSSPNGGAPTGALHSGDSIYYGDTLEISYSAWDGFSLISQGITSATVNSSLDANSIYAVANANSYSISWNDPPNCSISVYRDSSPYQGAPAELLSVGSTIYYGDTLSVSYEAHPGYTVTDTGANNITVAGNVDSSVIYASVTGGEITYRIVCRSVNGTDLGTETVTKTYGSEHLVDAPKRSGYQASGQYVMWDTTESKDIVFDYTPVNPTNPDQGGFLSDYESSGHRNPTVTFTVSFAYQNRTANSVEVKLDVTQTIHPYFYCNMIHRVNASANGVPMGDIVVVNYMDWSGQVDYPRSASASTGWTQVPLNTTGETSVTIHTYFYDANLNGTDLSSPDFANLNRDWIVNIPAY